ncbi:calcineurin B homologous protein 1-like [Corticium candelabrum]|uniref:calcineurin B homologous protein 1-like n=1 Tax=Corticium candelabrum TaxID=121492 RepID=UPI002E2632CF|nr:calcineurin B homologous protein 1-like [Corticium candelabrum]
MGVNFSRALKEDETAELSAATGFSARQIVRLYSRYSTLDKENKGYLSREDFEHIPELAINPLGDRIIAAFMDGSQDEHVNFKQFLSVLARFRPIKKHVTNQSSVNSKEEKLRFAFNMYDLDRDGKISAHELTEVLKMMVGSNVSPEQLQSIASLTMKEVDFDQDGTISFDDFQQAMKGIKIEEKMSIRFLS